MMDLRQKLIAILDRDCLGHTHKAADRILAMSEIAEALLHQRATKEALDNFGEFTIKADQ